MANIAIIPARGGSKRVPDKNIRDLGGKPLIAWTIKAALESKCFDRVIVSTDNKNIAKIATEFGAEVPFIRPSEFSGDKATSDSVIKHAVEWVETETTINIEIVALLQPTSPFRTARQIQESLALFKMRQADGVISVGECNTRIELCNTLPKDKSLNGFLKSTEIKRTQDMKQLYEINGAIYLFKRYFSGKLSSLYNDNARSFAFIMDSFSSVDIDSELDFNWAEFLLNKNEN